jgi:RNA polymerase sigma factor (sigma-70 family)
MALLTADELCIHIRGCSLNSRESQEKIYRSFYGYAMAVCTRYTNNPEDAIEILNDGFLKIFREVHHYKPAYTDTVGSFRGWLRKIMVYTAIDHFRKNQRHKVVGELKEGVFQLAADVEAAPDKLSYKEIIEMIQQLTPGYRIVLNLFVVEGLSHEEIAEQLGISTGTSKSNLAKARKQLQKILHSNYETLHTRHAG